MKVSEISLKSLLVFLAVAEAVVGYLPRWGIGVEIGIRSAATQNSVTPAGYAFAIWAIIYLALFVYAVIFAWRGVERAIGVRLAIAMTANTLWAFYVQMVAIDWVSVLIIFAGLLAALSALGNAARLENAGMERALARIASGLLAGWLTIAAAANIAAAMQFADLSFGDLSEPVIALLIMLAFGGVAILSAARTRSFFYAAAAFWGLAAIAARRFDAGMTMDIVLGCAAVAIGFAIVGIVFAVRRARV